jgi:hypothetical protein
MHPLQALRVRKATDQRVATARIRDVKSRHDQLARSEPVVPTEFTFVENLRATAIQASPIVWVAIIFDDVSGTT